MKKIIALAALFALFAAGCTETQNDPIIREGAFSFTASGDSETRTELKDGKNIYWKAGDLVGVVDGSTLKQFSAVSSGAETKLNGEITLSDGQLAQETYYAVSPFVNGETTYSQSKYTLTIPTDQTPENGSFDPNANVATALTTKEEARFHFKNAVSYLKIVVPQDFPGTISSLRIRSLKDDPFAGEVTVSNNPGNPVVATTNSSSAVNISGNITPGEYYIPIIPGSKNNGIRIIAIGKDADGQGKSIIKTKSSNIPTFERNKVYTINIGNDWSKPLGEEYTEYIPCGRYVLMFEDGTLDRFNLYLTNGKDGAVFDSQNYQNYTNEKYKLTGDSEAYFHFAAQNSTNTSWKTGKEKGLGSGYKLDGDPNTVQTGLILINGTKDEDGIIWYNLVQCSYYAPTASSGKWQARTPANYLAKGNNGADYTWSSSIRAYKVRVFRIDDITASNYNDLN